MPVDGAEIWAGVDILIPMDMVDMEADTVIPTASMVDMELPDGEDLGLVVEPEERCEVDLLVAEEAEEVGDVADRTREGRVYIKT